MSDLSDAIKQWDSLDMDELMEPEATLIKAARTQEALYKSIDLHRLSDGLRFAHITDSDGDYLIHVAKQVQAALTPGDTECPTCNGQGHYMPYTDYDAELRPCPECAAALTPGDTG